MKRSLMIALLFVIGLILIAGTLSAQEAADDALLARGAYVAEIGGCIACHTPYQAEYEDFANITPEQLQTLGLFAYDTLDLERLGAGGRAFDLGPGGVVISKNLTPDEATGLGAWTDEEIEAAIRIGVSKDGRRLHPLMPYRNYFFMARDDMRALIAYLRSIPAVENEVPISGPSGEGIAPELVPDTELLETAPDGSDPVALGDYLVNAIMSCTDCHTPFDPETGAPLLDQFLAGGQPYEGPWGIVYGANITPHNETGLGLWSDEDIAKVFRLGVRIDGRRLVLMPWQDYMIITDEDLAAMIAYLRQIPAVDNEIPAPAITDLFLQYAEE